MSTQNTTLRGLGFAFLGFAVFASHDALIKVLGGTYSVMQIIFFATLFSFVPMAVTILTDRATGNFMPRHPALVMLRSGLMVTGMSCAFYAFSVLPLAEVYSLLFSFPLIVTVLSIPILGEVVRAQRWAAVVVGLIGVLIVLRPGSTEITLGHLAALTAAFCSAFASVLVRKIGNEERSAVLILYPMLLAIAVMSLLQPAVYQPPSLLHLAMMALVGVFSVIAQHLIILAYRAAPRALLPPASTARSSGPRFSEWCSSVSARTAGLPSAPASSSHPAFSWSGARAARTPHRQTPRSCGYGRRDQTPGRRDRGSDYFSATLILRFPFEPSFSNRPIA